MWKNHTDRAISIRINWFHCKAGETGTTIGLPCADWVTTFIAKMWLAALKLNPPLNYEKTFLIGHMQHVCVQVLRALGVVPGRHQAPPGRRVRLQSEDPQQRTHRRLHLQLHPGEPDPQKRSLPQWPVKKWIKGLKTSAAPHMVTRPVSVPRHSVVLSWGRSTIRHSHKQHAAAGNINPASFISNTAGN